MKTAVFIGHSECYDLPKEELCKVIVGYIEHGVTNFVSGGQGRFDLVSARTVFNLKTRYPNIKNILVIPYLSFNIFERDIFDEIIFPAGFEKYSYRAAIPQRNRYMVNISDIAICYIKHGWGNAVKTYEYAKKRNLEIKNLSTYDG